jgi:hypothetical protein
MKGSDREEKRAGMDLIEYVENVKVENGKVKLKENGDCILTVVNDC